MATKRKATKAKAKKSAKKTARVSSSNATTSPKFPYSTKPNSLRKFLELVPSKPRPGKVNAETLKTWGLRDTNDQTIIRVLKSLGLVGSNNKPTDRYTDFMTPEKGPGVLATAIREVWGPLFEASHNPHRDDDTALRNYFNIHSGGSEGTIAMQIQTFKAACDHADFGSTLPAAATTIAAVRSETSAGLGHSSSGAAIHIDLHIHLPENKSRRDYEYMFEDIERYILGRRNERDSSDKS